MLCWPRPLPLHILHECWHIPQEWTAGDELALLQGISLSATIWSWPFTFTTAHTEDLGLGSGNDLVLGRGKVRRCLSTLRSGRHAAPFRC